MSEQVVLACPDCKKFNIWNIADRKFSCQQCGKLLGEMTHPDDIFDACPICTCRQFYTMKDFNRFIGCSIMLAGILLVPFTYGLSLPFFALIDWLIYRKVPSVIVCYRCGCEFKGFDKAIERFKPFMHHIGLKYDKYR